MNIPIKTANDKSNEEKIGLTKKQENSVKEHIKNYGYQSAEEFLQVAVSNQISADKRNNRVYETLTPARYLEETEQHIKKFIENNPNSSKPLRLFIPNSPCRTDYENYIFSTNNWNGNDIVRQIIHKGLECHGLISQKYNIRTKNDKVANVQIFFSVEDDFKRTIIIVQEDNHVDYYEVQWYKNRGKTSLIRKNGYFINLVDYIELYDILQPCTYAQDSIYY